MLPWLVLAAVLEALLIAGLLFERTARRRADRALTDNGLDAMRESPSAERTIVLSTAADGPDAIRVSVRDSGTGIGEADLDHVFEAFYTTKTDGLGMGLAIARSIVEGHGGRLTAQNEAAGGATVSFTVPAGGPGP